MNNKTIKGHFTAFITIMIWGTTFISTKILLVDFTPTEILFFRFLLGLAVLIIIYPKRLKIKNIRQELTFAAAGLCGICLYYLLENIALSYTLASNVGVIISIAPFFTAILSRFFIKNEEKLKVSFFIGFLVAVSGICLISMSGAKLKLNPVGDILAVAASLVWSIYSLLTRKIGDYGYNTIQTTRRIFIYGIIFMLPVLFVFDFSFDIQKLVKPEYVLNLIYLGVAASAVCFVTWNYAVKILGAVKTSAYIYIVPVITVVTSAVVLKEKITVSAAIGTGLTIAGLFISQYKFAFKKGVKSYGFRK
ncbi:MAG: DMT family transporter [Eubacterium sp.]